MNRKTVFVILVMFLTGFSGIAQDNTKEVQVKPYENDGRYKAIVKLERQLPTIPANAMSPEDFNLISNYVQFSKWSFEQSQQQKIGVTAEGVIEGFDPNKTYVRDTIITQPVPHTLPNFMNFVLSKHFTVTPDKK